MKQKTKRIFPNQKKRLKKIFLNQKNAFVSMSDIEYKETRDVRNLFNLSTKEDYYKPIRIISVFDKKTVISYMKVEEIKTKFYQLKNILLLSDHI